MRPALLLALLAGSAFARANDQPYPIGERASGLGGAFTALSDDEWTSTTGWG